ncbi:MAG: hypothetical protein ACU84Q_11335 [Gammaproteobacteria bacterium]
MSFKCWRCGEVLNDVPMPLSRTETCPHCYADTHVCKQCNFYDTGKANHCSEPVADHVSDKTRANFCGYLSINIQIEMERSSNPDISDDLNALFGLDHGESNTSPATGQKAKAALDDLFDLKADKKK